MSAAKYVALLRGINVGGRNVISMADLRGAFEAEAYAGVRTYIQSGNVVFAADSPRATLEGELEAMLHRRLGVDLVVVVRSARQLRSIVAKAPSGFGVEPDVHHSDVVFLKQPLTAARAMRAVETREGVDQAWRGSGVLYFQRLSDRLSQSRMSKIASKPEYKLMTIRNWRTTNKLLEMVAE